MNKNDPPIPVKAVIPIDQLFGDDEEDTRLLLEMAQKARTYLQDFKWCKKIRDAYFGDGYGGIIAVFFFRIEPTSPDIDEWLWVVVGDLPSAYLVINKSLFPSQAVESYIEEMSKWVSLAKRDRSSVKVIPVNVPATPENAKHLDDRLKFLKEIIVPAFRTAETERA